MTWTSDRPAEPPFSWRAGEGPGAADLLLRAALVFTAYLAGVHLAAASSGATPDGVGADAPPAPACVGCHHGADDETPPPDGGLAGPERDALTRFGAGFRGAEVGQ